MAILLVVACHLLGDTVAPFDQVRALGSAGVTLFFTLSGFLITSLLIEERADHGRVSLPDFYARRARRLFPALTAAIAGLLLLGRVLGIPVVFGLWAVVLYVGNWFTIAGGNLGLLNVTWSLSIEEQFYLLWPVVLLVSTRWRRGPLAVTVAGIVASTGLRFWLGGLHGGGRVYAGSDTEAASLLIGSLLALLAHRGLREVRVSPWLIGVGAVGLFGWGFAPGEAAASVWVPTIVPWVGAALIWAVCSSPGGLMGSAVMRYLGRRSYGLYLWHATLIWLVAMLVGPSLAWGCVAVVLAVGIAEMSWRLVERPFVRQGVNGPGCERSATADAPLMSSGRSQVAMPRSRAAISDVGQPSARRGVS